jgi:hypothetical protein
MAWAANKAQAEKAKALALEAAPLRDPEAEPRG